MWRFLQAIVRYGWSAAGLQRQTSYLEAKIERLRVIVADTETRLIADRIALEDGYAEFTSRYNRALTTIEDGLRANRKLTEALDAAHEELRTCREIQIPGLVTAHETIVKRMEADIAASAMRAAVAGPQGRLD